MWASIVDRDGIVRTVAHSGEDRGDQWPGSRIISAQKAYTANAFSLPGFAMSTANLYTIVQSGQFAFGIQHSNPVNPVVAYAGAPEKVGTTEDGMIGGKIGGVNVFGGGLALYNSEGTLIGGIGVSGDTSTADHNIAWRLRAELGLDYVPAGPHTDGNDNIVYDLVDGKSASGWGHPETNAKTTEISKAFTTRKKA
jgi:uncharacterized protein GlcG (DUF336 family)